MRTDNTTSCLKVVDGSRNENYLPSVKLNTLATSMAAEVISKTAIISNTKNIEMSLLFTPLINFAVFEKSPLSFDLFSCRNTENITNDWMLRVNAKVIEMQQTETGMIISSARLLTCQVYSRFFAGVVVTVEWSVFGQESCLDSSTTNGHDGGTDPEQEH